MSDLPIEFWDDETQSKLDSVDWNVWQGIRSEEVYKNESLVKIRMHCKKIPIELVNAQRVTELKQNLANTDYVVQKITEAQVGAIIIPEDDYNRYEQIIKQRQEWRDEINRLEVNNK